MLRNIFHLKRWIKYSQVNVVERSLPLLVLEDSPSRWIMLASTIGVNAAAVLLRNTKLDELEL